MRPRTTVRTRSRPSRGPTGGVRAGRRAGLGRLVALAAVALVPVGLLAPTVLAHHFTGEVQLWVSTVDFGGSPDGVLMSVKLIERESGESVSGFGVRVTATGRGEHVGPVELQESEFAVYTGALPLGPGVWQIVATAHQGNSSLPAIEATHRETLEVDGTGQPVVPAGGGSATATTLAVVLPVCAVVALLLVLLRRRRAAPDGAADAGDDPAPDHAAGAPAVDDPAADRGVR